MQEPRPELNQRLLGALLCAAAGTGALLWARWPQLGKGPLPDGYPPEVSGAASAMAVVAGAAAAGGVAILFLLLRSRARAGAFAALFGGALAAGLPVLCEHWCGQGSATWLAPAAALVTVTALPLLRERGLLSLCLVPAVAVQPALWARQAVMAREHAAVALRTLQHHAPLSGPVGLSLPEGTEPALVQAFTAGLRQPCFPIDLDAWPVPDAMTGEWLLRSGAPLLRLEDGKAWLRQPPSPSRRQRDSALRVEVVVLEAGGLQVRAGARADRGTFAVFTPWGCLTGGLDEDGNGALDGNAWRTLPAGEQGRAGRWIRVLAVSRGDEAAYGSADLCLP